MVNFTILAGGFSTFVATYVFDSDASTLSLVKQTPTGTNPSWIASHPSNSKILYAVNEVGPIGSLQSFSVDAEGGLTLVDTVTTGGNGPTFTNPLTTGEVTAMNFGSPNCSLVATDPNDPLKFLKDSPVVSFPVGDGPSNPHMSLEVNGEVLVPDLGADKIWRLAPTGQPGNFVLQGQIDVDAGSGPRHIAVRDGVLFTIHEKTSTLTAQLIPPAPNGTSLGLLANVSIIPEKRLADSKFFAAEILISTPTEQFPEPLIYVSNRNLGATIDPAGDTIAIFRFNGAGNGAGAGSPGTPTPSERIIIGADVPIEYNNAGYAKRRMVKRHRRALHARQAQTPPVLELLAQVPTGLQQIRSMTIGSVAGGGDQFLIAGANTQGGIAMFRRIDGGANLELVARNLELGNRTSFVFI